MSKSSTPQTTILEHQHEAFKRLKAVGRAAFSTHRPILPMRLRTNTLIVGPSGTGKTFLAKAAAEALAVPFLELSVSDWILIGCSQRGAVTTWPRIVKFLAENECKNGVVIFIDEIDKVAAHDCSYVTFLRTEVYQLLDGTVPSGLCYSDGDGIKPRDLRAAQDILLHRTLIVAAGAFQSLWEAESKTPIGFSGYDQPSGRVSLDRLSNLLPRELINRFCAEVIALPRLSASDYTAMVHKTVPLIPLYLRDTFERVATERVKVAAENQQGCRFLEEALLDSVIERLRLGEEQEAGVSQNKPGLQP